MTAKFFVMANRISGALSVEPASILSAIQSAYAHGEQPATMVLAQVDDEAQAERFLELLRNSGQAT